MTKSVFNKLGNPRGLVHQGATGGLSARVFSASGKALAASCQWHPTSQTRFKHCSGHRYVAAFAVLAMLLGGTGCSLLVDPFTDELAGQPPVVTPSVEGALAVEAESIIPQRGYGCIEVPTQIGTVTHGPLYFEDGFEDGGSDDGRFAWTGEDYLHLFYWRGRFLVNGALFPVSAVVTPPWTLMASDGRVSRELLGIGHDAKRWPGCPEVAEAPPPPPESNCPD